MFDQDEALHSEQLAVFIAEPTEREARLTALASTKPTDADQANPANPAQAANASGSSNYFL